MKTLARATLSFAWLELKALRFYLHTKLRDRGYSDRVDDTGATDLSGNITVLHSIPGLEE